MWSSGNLLGVFAQETTTQSGFAIVTPVSGNIGGLVATETLRHSTSADVEHTVIGPSTLVTAASLPVFVGVGTANTTAIAIANPSNGSGGVNMVLTNNFGGFFATATIQLGPRGQLAIFLNDIFSLQSEVVSTPLLLTMSSELPVAVLALNFQGEDFASIPLTSLSFPTPVPVQPLVLGPTPTAMPGFGLGVPPPAPTFTPPVVLTSTAATTPSIGGNASLVFAQVAIGGEWSTDITVANTSAGAQIVRIDFFSPNGINIGSLPDIAIEPRGVFFFSTNPAAAGIQ
jgi:hypothetical protein